ncbi:hypothetical protein LJY25_01020 [Hymenobacter sp. BT175]|uniref:hypothetical protein n=1 Tax=Hymenobacter translucens TaxID=2886507 RepID=UPI001D0DCC60|nr:hypothetical protein [Hymenobacter translucens]MCC2545011.1 hypothetical protein [Hymenobacter translucens]
MKTLLLVGLALAAQLVLPAHSPRFNDNFVIRTRSLSGRHEVLSIPQFCTNRTRGCVRVAETGTGKVLYSFDVNRLTGTVYVATADPTTLIRIGTGIGGSPAVKIPETTDAPDVYLQIYRAGVLADSVRIPAVTPVAANEEFYFTGRRLDRSRLLHHKPDTLAIVTHRGLALLACHGGRVTVSLAPGYERLRTFRLMNVNARQVCFPYPQPATCADVPPLPEAPDGSSHKGKHR